jgi:hypothetical protein
MYRLITMTGESLIVRDVEGSGLHTIYVVSWHLCGKTEQD